MAAPNQLLIDILTKVTGTSDVKAHMKAVRDLSGGVHSLSQTYKMYEKGVKSALNGDEAVRKILPVISGNLRETAGGANEAAAELEELANALNTVDAAADAADGTMKTGRQTVGKLHNTTKSANYTLLSLAQTFQDSSQFSMGYAQGIRAITNNAQVFVQSLLTLQEKAKDTGMTLGQTLRGAFFGPMGWIIAFSVVTSALEIFTQRMQQAQKGAKAFRDALSSVGEVSNPFGEGGFANYQAMEGYLRQLEDARGKIKDVQVLSNRQRGFVPQSLLSRAEDSAQNERLVEVAERYDMTVGQLNSRLKKTIKAFEEQVEIQKNVEFAYDVYIEMTTLAERVSRRLGFEIAELQKKHENLQQALMIAENADFRVQSSVVENAERRLRIRQDILNTIDNESEVMLRMSELERRSLADRQQYFFIKRQENLISESAAEIAMRAEGAAERELALRQEISANLSQYMTKAGRVLLIEEARTAAAERQAAAAKDLAARIGILKETPQLLRQEGRIGAQEEVVGLGEELERLKGELDEYKLAQMGASDTIDVTNRALARQRIEIYNTKNAIDELNGVSLAELAIQLSSIIESGFENAIIDFATALGSGGDLFKKAAGSILKSVGTLAVNLGKAMVQFGVAGRAIQKFAEGKPQLAIPAGIALIALGKALQSKASGIMANAPAASGGGGGTASASGGIRGLGSLREFNVGNLYSGTPNIGSAAGFPSLSIGSMAPQGMQLQLVARGPDLVSAVDAQRSANTRLIGGSR